MDADQIMENRKNFFASLNLSSAIRFRPTEKQLVGQFLLRKIRGTCDPDDPIVEADLYATEPSLLWETYSSSQEQSHGADVDDKDEILYFYTKLKSKKLSNGERKSSRIDRAVADGKGGTWHQEAVSKIYVRHHLVTKKKNKQGSISTGTTTTSLMEFEKKRFSYKNPENAKEHGCWIMHEYSCLEKRAGFSIDWVICRLHKNPKYSRAKSSSSSMLLPSSPDSILDYDQHGGDDHRSNPKRSKVINSATDDEQGRLKMASYYQSFESCLQ